MTSQPASSVPPLPSEDDLARRKRFMCLGEREVELLRALHAQLAASTDDRAFAEFFYGHLLQFEETARFLRDPQRIERLKDTQARYFRTLTAGDYGAPYVQERLRVGAAHQRIGLAPAWYMGAYLNYFAFLLPRIRTLCADDPVRATDTVLALLRIVMFDMSLAIDTYIQADAQAIRAQSERLRALNRAVEAIIASLSLDDSLRAVLQHGAALTGSQAAAIAIHDEQAGGFRQCFTHGLSPRFVEGMRFRPGGLADTVLRSGVAVVSNDAPHAPHRLSAVARAEGIRAFICLPLAGAHGRHGVLYVYRTDRDDFSAEETELLATFARLAAAAIDNARLYEQTVQQARTDALTGVLNRREFDARLAAELRRARRYGKACALLLLDIDHFKQVNDNHGHPAGDSVLQALARLLAAQLRDVDCVARYGGEEFVALLPETDDQAACAVAERVRAAVAGCAFALADGTALHITVSIGVASFPRSGDSAGALVTHADQALYAAKQAGRNRVQRYRERARR